LVHGQLPQLAQSGHSSCPRRSPLGLLRPEAPLYILTFLEIPVDKTSTGLQNISMKIEIAARQLEALGNPTRLAIYRALIRSGDTGLPVGRLQEKLGIAGSTLSHHLHRLILTGLVSQERQVTTLICRANYPAMNDLVGFLVNECCIDAKCLATEDDNDRH
jgi:ArsR family transcriptional regulator